MNKSTTSSNRFFLTVLVILYLLLFLTALVSSAYFFERIIQLRPIPMLGFLKYILLCILFLVLLIIAIRALTLKTVHLSHLASATANFKWLFTLTLVICIAAKAGLFNLNRNHPVEISYVQIGILTAIALFCYWSDRVLKGEETFIEENDHEV
ncbi:hypothetical protein H7F33_16310 [Pedobacter sp. PAMC26386]|nr:hypothetical protein H7F33_16310 [Pedobacter sp. PAMC26386]